MELLCASELADRLSLSRGRFSQLVSEGKSDGCYEGEDRNRRFSLAKCVTCLERGLDFGQVHGNGAEAAAAWQDVLRDLAEEKESLPKFRSGNLAFEQSYALRSEVDIQVRRVLQKEFNGAGSYLYRLLDPTRAQRGYAAVLLQIELTQLFSRGIWLIGSKMNRSGSEVQILQMHS